VQHDRQRLRDETRLAPCHDKRMGSLFFSPHGRIARKPFAIGAAVVYLLIVASQLLLSAPLTARANVIPFALAQGLLTYAWYALHGKRLRDAGRATGAALAIAVLYAMSVVLFILLLELVVGPGNGGADGKEGGLLTSLLVWIALGAVLAGMQAMDLFLYLAIVIAVLILLPFVIAVGFSIWLATRPSAPVPP